MTVSTAIDGFADYYTEKLWAWIPEHYREQDALTPTPGTLRALVEQLGAQAAAHRRKLDRLWENNFVELADDDVLARLGEIVATRMVHAANRRGRRVDVARTIYYRRRKGTPRVLESLITDITGWTGVHLDTRSRLARTAHLLEPSPDLRRGPFTRTPRGGVADLRSPRIPELAWTGFEELSHTPDFRRYDEGNQGRYGLHKIGVHLYRMRALELALPTAKLIENIPDAANCWTLDPSGREVPLFQPADRPTADGWVKPREWQMPKSLERRLLAHAEFEWTDEILDSLDSVLTPAAITLLKKYSGWRIPSELELRRLIDSFPQPPHDDILDHITDLMVASLTSDSGEGHLYGADLDGDQAVTLATGTDNPGTEIPWTNVTVANLSSWASNGIDVPANAQAVLDPQTGRVMTREAENTLMATVLHYGFPAEIGAGTYDRRFYVDTTGVTTISNGDPSPGPIALPAPAVNATEEIVDNKTYTISGNYDLLEEYRLQARNGMRPYVVRSSEALTWTIKAADKPGTRTLVLEGLWIGIQDPTPAVGDPPEAKLILDGVWDQVVIRHCTLDPGGQQAATTSGTIYPIPYVQLEVKGQVEELIIESSITGPIIEQTSPMDPCSIGKLVIRDSIVSAVNQTSFIAINTKIAEVHIERSTILGNITANRIYASDTLVTGEGTITDLQNGCFRFSAGVDGGWPHPFESYLFTTFSGAWIASPHFGNPDFGRLTEITPDEILRGAENHCTMGAFNQLVEQIRSDDFVAKFEEFVPFGLIPQLDIEN
jgi:hypothetical protein